MKTEKELKEEIEDLEYYQKRIEKIRTTPITILNKKKFEELQEELENCEKQFNSEKLNVLKAQLKTLQERDAEVKKVIEKIFERELKQEIVGMDTINKIKELLKKLGLEDGE